MRESGTGFSPVTHSQQTGWKPVPRYGSSTDSVNATNLSRSRWAKSFGPCSFTNQVASGVETMTARIVSTSPTN